MYFGNIKYCDISNGTGVRVSLFVSGCSNHCKGCFQPQTWNPKYGKEFTESYMKDIMNALCCDYISGLTILGGDPFYQDNIVPVSKIIKRIRNNKVVQKKTIWVYSGYTYDELVEFEEHPEEVKYILDNIDVLVDGRFEEDKLTKAEAFKGSTNQRIIDMKNTTPGNVVLLSKY